MSAFEVLSLDDVCCKSPFNPRVGGFDWGIVSDIACVGPIVGAEMIAVCLIAMIRALRNVLSAAACLRVVD